MFEALGLEPEDEQVYLTLLERGPLAVADISGTVLATPAKVRATVGRLESMGLVSRGPGRPVRYQPAPPEVALETLALQRQRSIAAARDAAMALQRRLGGRVRDPGELVEIVVAPDQIRQRFLQLQYSATEEILNFDAPPYLQEPADIDVELGLLQAGVHSRVIYSADALEIPERMAALGRLVVAGQKARCLSRLPIKLVVVDRRTALLPLQIERSQALAGAVIVHESSLLDMLVLSFEDHWRRATPIRSGPVRPPDGGEVPDVSPTEQTMLSLLAAGQKDQAVARQLGVTVRTVRRHIHDLGRKLECDSRFQLALQAKQRGWL